MIQAQIALVVHTRWAMRRLAQTTFRGQGWDVIVAATVEEAIRVLDRTTVQMLAVERRLKDERGRLVRDILRSHPRAIGAQVVEIGSNPLFPDLDLPKERFLGNR